jgi:hypothetical protein
MRWTPNARDVRAGNVRRSRVVLTSRCWRQVAQKHLHGDSGKRAVHWGEHEVSRKATAQGRPGCSRWTCMLVCAFFCAQCTRDRGCSAHPVFPAPSIPMGAKKMQSSGTTCREIADTHSLVIPATGSAEWPPDDRLRRGSSIPEKVMIQKVMIQMIGRGVLDPRRRGDDSR